MAAIGDVVDYSRVVLILANIVGADGILSWSNNARFQFHPPAKETHWKGKQVNGSPVEPPFLILELGKNIFDPTGWVLGSSDADTCDIQIAATNQTGISRHACRIDISPRTYRPRVTQLSDRTIYVHNPTTTVRLKRDSSHELTGPVTIDFGALKFRGWVPKRTMDDTNQFRRTAELYSHDVMGSLPKRLPTNPSHDKTSVEYVRYGKDNAIYVVTGQKGRGAHASVMRVENVSTGEIFGAKEPYYNVNDNAGAARN